MWGVAPIPHRFVLARLLWAQSVRRHGALARARLFPAVPVGAGGWGGEAGRAPSPLSGGARGDHPLCLGGVGAGTPRLAGRGGGLGGGVAPRPPCSPSGGRSAVPYPGPPLVVGALPPGVRVRSGSRPPGVYSCREGCWASVGVGRGPAGRRWVSAAGEGGREGKPPTLVRAPAFLRPPSEGAASFAPSWAPPVRRRSAAGRAGACGRFSGDACRGRGAPSPRVQRPLRGGGAGPPSLRSASVRSRA